MADDVIAMFSFEWTAKTASPSRPAAERHYKLVAPGVRPRSRARELRSKRPVFLERR